MDTVAGDDHRARGREQRFGDARHVGRRGAGDPVGQVARGRVEGVRGTNLSAHEPLALLPPVRGAVGFGWRDRFAVDIDMYARPTRLNPLDIPTAGYALLHLSVGANLRFFGRNVRGDMSLRNALDQRYKSFLSRYKEFAFDPGRNLIVRFSSGFID